MVRVSFSNGVVTVAGGHQASSISQFYFDNGDGLEFYEQGDPSLITNGDSSLFITGNTAFLTTIVAHSDFIAEAQATPSISLSSVSHSLSETSPGVYDVIIKELATGVTYIVVSVGGTGFVQVGIPANVNIAYSRRTICIEFKHVYC